MPTYNELAEGGSTLGATSPRYVLYFVNAIGGSQNSGISKDTVGLSEVATSGIIDSGRAYVSLNLTKEVIVGVGWASGSAPFNIFRSVIASGSGLAGGVAERTDPVNHYPNLPDYDPLITVSGDAGKRFTARFDTEDGVTVGGDSRLRQNLSYVASDGVTLSSDNEYQFVLLIDLSLAWRARGRISVDRTILWDTGRLRQYFYRVVGKEKEDECNQLPCCMIFVVNISASTITNLCEKLRERQFRWPIESVHRFSRPAESIAIAEDEALGIDHLCNELEPVDICSVPICSEFCITADAVISIGLSVLDPQVNAFFVGEAEWDLDIDHDESSVLISGGAESTLEITIYSLFFTSGDNISSDSLVEMGGDSDISATDYQVLSAGGLILEGSSDAATEHWDFVGGQWPYQSLKLPLVAGVISASAISTESVSSWLQTQRILTSDNLSSLVDVSWNASSNYLLAKSFDFNLPENSRVGLIDIYIERKATFNVRDHEVYLVKGSEIISPNLANPAYFPLFDTNTRYSVVDDSFALTIPGVSEQVGGWDTDDINDSEFGVIVRVLGQVNIAGVIASIDRISMIVWYEDGEYQILRPSGEAEITASHWTYTASEGVELTSDTRVRTNFTFITSGGSTIGGEYKYHFNYEVTDDSIIEIAGDSQTTCNHIEGLGGVSLNGETYISASRNAYYPDGESIEVSFGLGEAATRVTYKKIASEGGVTIDGEGFTFPVQGYSAVGGISLEGEVDVVTSAWHWFSDGNAVFPGGAAVCRPSNFDDILTYIGFQMFLTDIDLVFGADVETGSLTGASDTISVCGCIDIPVVLNLSHNLVNRNKFSHFLARNDLSMPRDIKLYHNTINDMWQGNFNFKGISADFDTLEVWNLLFDVRCTQIVGGVDIEQEILMFSMQITQKNLSTLEDFSTRVIIGFLPDAACANGILQTKIIYDTKLDVATVKAQAQIYYYNLFDDLDLFKNDYWTRNPELKIQFSSVNLEQLQYRQNMDIVFHRPAGGIFITS